MSDNPNADLAILSLKEAMDEIHVLRAKAEQSAIDEQILKQQLLSAEAEVARLTRWKDSVNREIEREACRECYFERARGYASCVRHKEPKATMAATVNRDPREVFKEMAAEVERLTTENQRLSDARGIAMIEVTRLTRRLTDVCDKLATIEAYVTDQPGEYPTPSDERWSPAFGVIVHVKEERDALRADLGHERGVISMTVHRLGGVVEGAPTGRHNFLQRIDELLAAEEECDALRADLARVSEEMGLPPAIGPAPGVLRRMRERVRVRDARVEPPSHNTPCLVWDERWLPAIGFQHGDGENGYYFTVESCEWCSCSDLPSWLPMPPAPEVKP